MTRKLASIQKIVNVSPIEGADLIEKVQILGWECVTKKGEFQPGDFCVYFEIDSILPDKPVFEFMRSKNFRVRTIKLRGQISQGLALPVSVLKEFGEWPETFAEGDDVTEILEVTKVPDKVYTSGNPKGNFPYFLFKTDETRIQSEPEILDVLRGKDFYATEKLDGTSFTAYLKDGEFGVCSRTLELKETENNIYWQMVRKYDLDKIMLSVGVNMYIQGEIAGPGIQGNRQGLKEVDLFIFNIGIILGNSRLPFREFITFCSAWGLKHVPIVHIGTDFQYTLEELLEMADGESFTRRGPREGLVFRSQDDPRLSFKVVSNKYLLGEKE